MINRILFILFVFIPVIHSCVNPDQKKSVSSKENYVPEPDNQNANEQGIYYLYPSPQDLMEFISESNIRFHKDLIFNAKLFEKFNTGSMAKTLIGVYLADLAYCNLLNQNQDARLYLYAVSKLSHNIYLSGNLKTELSQLLENDISSFDSIHEDITNLFYKIKTDLEDSKQHETVSLISAGAYIEALYLIVFSVDFKIMNEDLQNKIGQQQFAFKNFVEYIKSHQDNQIIPHLLPEFERLLKIMNEMKFETEAVESVPAESNKIRITGGSKFRITHDEFKELREIVTNLRFKILNNM
jgi:hypothetical protein